MNTKVPIVLLCLSLAFQASTEEAPKVKTPVGKLTGYYKESWNGRRYEAYEGIPYALPPVGELRFKPPRRAPAWVGELPATKFASPCLQYTVLPHDPEDRVEGAEDCLYLNVYTPVRNKKNNDPLPVLFWIHGGAFQFGTGITMSAKYLLDHNVVFVTINYRLGPLGFLSTEDEVVPGNMGLKDQSLALQWVSENIEWFGGDPKRITLVGMSAGGASVHYHYLSKMSAGLFQGGMSISGTAFASWAQTEKSAEKAKKLGALMGCPTGNSKEMIRCLRYRPARAMMQAVEQYMTFMYNPFTPFGPIAEKVGVSNSPFIDKTPAEIVSSGEVQDVPWITSTVSEEGIYPAAEFLGEDLYLRQFDENWRLIAPDYFHFNDTASREKHAEIADLIRHFYFGDKPINKQAKSSIIQMSTDRFFLVDSELAARMQATANKNPVWYYYYTYRAMESMTSALGSSTANYGVSHGDDVFLVIDTPWMKPVTQEDFNVQKHLIDMWISFATNGIPNVAGVEWPKLDPSEEALHYLRIDNSTSIYMSSAVNFGEKQFWNSLNFNENKVKTIKNDEL